MMEQLISKGQEVIEGISSGALAQAAADPKAFLRNLVTRLITFLKTKFKSQPSQDANSQSMPAFLGKVAEQARRAMKKVGFADSSGGGVVSRSVGKMKVIIANATRTLKTVRDKVVGGMKFLSTSESVEKITSLLEVVQSTLLNGTDSGPPSLAQFAAFAAGSIETLFEGGLGSRVRTACCGFVVANSCAAGLTCGVVGRRRVAF